MLWIVDGEQSVPSVQASNSAASTSPRISRTRQSIATCTLPASSAAGMVQLNFTRDWVTNSSGFHSASTRFMYTPDVQYAAINPGSGPVSGGTIVTLHGSSFFNSTKSETANKKKSNESKEGDLEVEIAEPIFISTHNKPLDISKKNLNLHIIDHYKHIFYFIPGFFTGGFRWHVTVKNWYSFTICC